jgi:hypothetical protein
MNTRCYEPNVSLVSEYPEILGGSGRYGRSIGIVSYNMAPRTAYTGTMA